MSPAAAPKLKVEGLQSGYGDVQVLWDVSLDVMPGEIVAIIGSNGAGKSTIMRTVSGMIPAWAGTIAIDGTLITGASTSTIVKAGIAHVPEGRRLFSAMSVRDNLLMGAYLRTDASGVAEDLEKVYEMFPILAERRRQDAGTMSGGEQQMCAIGRGLMSRPSLLLIDELSLGLAPRIVDELSERLRMVNATGVAILLVEQDVLAGLELANRAFVVDRGRVTLSGKAADLVNNPAVREAYMGVGAA